MLGREHSGKVSKKFIGKFYFWGITLTLTQSVWIGFELILSWQLSNIYGILTTSPFLRSAKFADRGEVEAAVCTPKPDTKNQKVKKKITERNVFSRPRQWRHSWGFRVSLLIKRSVHKYSKYSEYTKYSKLQSCEWNDSIKEITSIVSTRGIEWSLQAMRLFLHATDEQWLILSCEQRAI